jgi:hypothetical protein
MVIPKKNNVNSVLFRELMSLGSNDFTEWSIQRADYKSLFASAEKGLSSNTLAGGL